MKTEIFIKGEVYYVNKILLAAFTGYENKLENDKGILLQYRFPSEAKKDIVNAYHILSADPENMDAVYLEGDSLYLENNTAKII